MNNNNNQPTNNKSHTDIIINPQIYAPSAIYSTCNHFLEDNYIFITELKNKLNIKITPKNPLSRTNLELISCEFNNLLISQTTNLFFASKNKLLLKIMLETIKKTNSKTQNN
ncbi:MAG: hypothetical protein KAS30_04155 [Candidatus Diapherotrites archaeon]|nr:hypothetical protein [Candidatus Diapherotrites archaeon]